MGARAIKGSWAKVNRDLMPFKKLKNLSKDIQSQWGIYDWTPGLFPFTTLSSSSTQVMAQQLAGAGDCPENDKKKKKTNQNW